MTALEILWWWFWRSLLCRQHERPSCRGLSAPHLIAPARCRAAWKETMDMVRHSAGCLTVARPLQRHTDIPLPEEKR